MDEQIKQIGERLKGLREVLDFPTKEVAELCGITNMREWRKAKPISLSVI